MGKGMLLARRTPSSPRPPQLGCSRQGELEQSPALLLLLLTADPPHTPVPSTPAGWQRARGDGDSRKLAGKGHTEGAAFGMQAKRGPQVKHLGGEQLRGSELSCCPSELGEEEKGYCVHSSRSREDAKRGEKQMEKTEKAQDEEGAGSKEQRKDKARGRQAQTWQQQLIFLAPEQKNSFHASDPRAAMPRFSLPAHLLRMHLGGGQLKGVAK
ncbi:uncharacterized protein [Melanerpes formicivorus]|uniref:uncharacterized protein n=1 Tax=Melanerpes formicivorus TaxID=211600 RepID=UPI00358F9263